MLKALHWTRLSAPKKSQLLGFALSFGIGASLYLVTDGAIEQDANDRFTTMAHNAQATLNGRVKSYADVLRGTASLFATTPTVTREQFHRYVKGLELETEFPGIETVNFARQIKDAERPAFESEMRAQLPEANVDPATFRIFPPGRRDEYTVLTYIEPRDPWTNRYGMDLQARATVALTLANSRDTGEPSTSGTRVKLHATGSGLAMRMPVYRPDRPLATVADRRNAYLGSVGIGFGVDRLVHGVLDGMPQGMHLIVTGMSPDEQPGGPRGAYRRMVFFDNMAGKRVAAEPHFELQLPIGVRNRDWVAMFSMPKSKLNSDLDNWLPSAAMLVGALGTFLLFTLYQTLSSSREHAMALAREMTQELRASEARLQQTNERLRRLAAHAENIKEGERKRIAREIHDDLGQNLLALRIEADQLAARTAHHHPRLHARARMTRDQIDATIRSVRQIINDLRPNVLDLGLGAAVDWQIAEFRQRTGVNCELIQDKDEIPVSDRCATALFRILQESLTNITRHAFASHVRVELSCKTDHVAMSVTDNGVGIPAGGRQKSGSFGLVGVEERVKILGGTFEVGNAAGGGTRVQVTIPVEGSPAVTAQSALPEGAWLDDTHVIA
jgi:signal transduction histidine kinase